MSPIVVALAVTLAIEVPLVAALFRGQRARMAMISAATNLATNPAMNLLLAPHLPRGTFLLVGELAALVVEAAVYALASRDLPRACVASALANGASFGAGLLLFGA